MPKHVRIVGVSRLGCFGGRLSDSPTFMTRNREGICYSFTKKHGDRPSEDRSSDSVVSSKIQALFICPHCQPQCTGVLSRACHLLVGKTAATALGTISPHKIGEDDRG